MNGNSKREKIDAIVARAVVRALQAVAWDYPESAPVLRQCKDSIKYKTTYELTGNPYALRELLDAAAWKKPPKSK